MLNKKPSQKRLSKSLMTMQQSQSEPNCTGENTCSFASMGAAHPKRKSTGNLGGESSSFCPSAGSKDIWRSPGCYEIPNILGNAYLKPSPVVGLQLRSPDPTKQITKPPRLKPLPRSENAFEVYLQKLLPKTPVRSTPDPRTRYTNFKEIGSGVNGAVVRAVLRGTGGSNNGTISNSNSNANTANSVAIKRCKLDPDKEYRASIARELKLMASGHKNLIKLREVMLCRDDIWIAMDLMRCSVFAVLCQRALPEEIALLIGVETLKGLEYMHSKRLLHRDIKCENLLLGWHGEVKVADFGLAARTDQDNRDRLGTTKWMAPEVVREEPYDEKIDIWSLGITIIEMMDRVPPHYLIKDEEELFDIIATEPSPTFTYSYPSMYMRGLVAWLLDENVKSRPSAKDVLAVKKYSYSSSPLYVLIRTFILLGNGGSFPKQSVAMRFIRRTKSVP
ncbi:kinase-like domain-containing protein [Dichotomocladium elegans]|nr:kinase-like domain-containing protein [Dichotomocladium elegans]